VNGQSARKFNIEELKRRALFLLVAAVLVGGMVYGWGTGVSILLGGGLAWVNFRLKCQVVNALLGAGTVRNPTSLAMGFGAGLLLIFLGLFAIIHLSFLSLLGALVGLSIFVLAGLAEAVLMLVRR